MFLVIVIGALVGVGLFLLGFAFGVHMSESSAAVRWFRAHEAAERARRASVEEVRAAWREKRAREAATYKALGYESEAERVIG